MTWRYYLGDLFPSRRVRSECCSALVTYDDKFHFYTCSDCGREVEENGDAVRELDDYLYPNPPGGTE